MAKGRTLNPADSQRKAERKKELKKNKAERQKARDFALVKKDTSSFEDDIQRLEKAETDNTITASQRAQLSTLRAELTRIHKKKAEYVAEHPEHRKLVFRGRPRKSDQEAEGDGDSKPKERKLFNKHGIPKHPERSVYYHPVMNPFGVPPSGMRYEEWPLSPEEVDSRADDESEDTSDDGIAMPSGPPPVAKDAQREHQIGTDEQDSDDEITMPEGPPPSRGKSRQNVAFTRLTDTVVGVTFDIRPFGVLPPPPPLPPGDSLPLPPPIFQLFPSNFPPPPPQGFPSGFIPVPPGGFVQPSVSPPPPGFPVARPPPGFISHPATSARVRLQSNSSIQDPLTLAPHQTFQAYRLNAQLIHPLPSELAQGASGDPTSSPQLGTQPATSNPDTGTVSAPAQLRDFKKESTAFLPPSLKRKRPGITGSSAVLSTSRINAAPGADSAGKGCTGDGHELEPARPDLLGCLKSNFPTPVAKAESGEAVRKTKLGLPEATRGKDDYEKFMAEIGDILDHVADS